MKKLLIIHPFLFAIHPILFLFSHNIGAITFYETLAPMTIILGCTLLMLGLLRLILGNNYKKAGIVLSIFLLLFFSYGRIFVILDKYVSSYIIGSHQALFLLWGLFLVVSFYLIKKTSRKLDNLTNSLNIIALSLVLLSFINLVIYQFKVISAEKTNPNKKTANIEMHTAKSKNSAVSRDIYFIVLDGYANPTTLKEIYGYDNHQFTDYLTEKGFKVIHESRSNYALSWLSLASSLNMKYLDDLYDPVKNGSKEQQKTLKQMIHNSAVSSFLKPRGYKIIHFSSGVGITDYNDSADLNLSNTWGNELLYILVQSTMLRPFEKHIIVEDARTRILKTFSELAKIPELEGKKFIFAHITSPHPPFLFDAQGEPVNDTKFELAGPVWGEKNYYLNQLIFVNKKVEELVDQILQNSRIAPIIILQSDHGSYGTFYSDDFLVGDQVTDEMLKERMRNFSAYYLPSDSEDDLVYDSITNVNTFRLIFNMYFDTKYEFLDDQIYFSSWDYPYKFINVTDKVKFSEEYK